VNRTGTAPIRSCRQAAEEPRLRRKNLNLVGRLISCGIVRNLPRRKLMDHAEASEPSGSKAKNWNRAPRNDDGRTEGVVIVAKQFGALGPQPWFITGIPGEMYIKKDWE